MSNRDPVQFDSFLAPYLDDDNSRAQGIRAVEPAPTGSQAERGSLYVLVELMGDSPLPGQALENLHTVLQQTYYTAGGSVSAILEQAIQSAHRSLAALNRRTPATSLRAGILCAAVVQSHLVMASAGPGLALLATAGRLDQFPPDPSHFTNPIGGDTPPQPLLYRHQLAEGDVLFVGESDWILATNVKTLGGAVINTTRTNRFEVVEYLRQQSNQAQIPGLFIVFQGKRPSPALPSTAFSSTSFPGGLPTAVGAPPPVRGLPAPVTPPAVQPAPIPQSSVPLSSAPQSSAPQSSAPLPHTQMDTPRQRVPLDTTLAAVGAQLNQAAKRSAGWVKEFAGKVLPDRQSQSQPSQSQPSQREQWVGSAPTPSLAQPQPAAIPYTPPEPTRGSRARLFILLAILLPLLAFATVGILNLRQGAASQTEGIKLVEQAESQLAKADQALNLDDKAAARSALNDAQRYLNEAVALIGLTDRIRESSQRIQTEMQKLMNVRFLYSLDFPLVEFPPDAAPNRVVVFDQDVYILDVGRQVVEHFRTDPSRTVTEERSGAILKEGDVVEGVTVGRLVDITWQPRISGFADKASLLILDRNNNIFRYNRVDAATVVRLADPAQLQSVGLLETYNGRLYLVDEQANQIFRYSPAGLGYDDPPGKWFDPQVQVNLAGAVAFGIDSDIWLLMANGTMLRYSQGRQLPFSLDTSAGVTGQLSDMALSNAPDGKIYLADGSKDRILVFDKLGNYIEQLQAAESDALRGLRGLYLDEVSGTLFILTQTALYAQPLPD